MSVELRRFERRCLLSSSLCQHFFGLLPNSRYIVRHYAQRSSSASPSCEGADLRTAVASPIWLSTSKNGTGSSSSTLAIVFTSHAPCATSTAAATGGTPAVY